MYKMLLVDDDPFILEGLQTIIPWDELGIEIGGLAHDGEAAWPLLDSGAFHMMITDLRMPIMDGIQLIRYAKQRHSKVKCIVLSAYNEFTYVKEAAKLGIENYLTKPLDEQELLATLKNTIRKLDSERKTQRLITEGADIIKENVLYRMVTNDITEDELQERFELLGIDMLSEHYAMAAIRVISESVNSVYTKVKPLCEALLQGGAVGGYVFPDFAGNLLLLMKLDAVRSHRDFLHEFLSLCRERILSGFEMDALVTAGTVVEHSTQLNQSLQQALMLQEYYRLFPAHPVIIFDRTEHLAEDPVAVPVKDFMIRRDEEGLTHYLESLRGTLQRNDGSAPKVVFDLLFTMVAISKQLCSPAKIDRVIQNNHDILDFVRKSDNVQDTIVGFIRLSNQLIDAIRLEDQKVSPVVGNVLEQIRTRYEEPLSLKELADTLRVNATYLGQLFKKETGQLFNDYVNQQRVNAAKQLLLHTLLKTNEISRRAGFAHPNYFYTTFKKVTGYSPSDYRTQYRSEQG